MDVTPTSKSSKDKVGGGGGGGNDGGGNKSKKLKDAKTSISEGRLKSAMAVQTSEISEATSEVGASSSVVTSGTLEETTQHETENEIMVQMLSKIRTQGQDIIDLNRDLNQARSNVSFIQDEYQRKQRTMESEMQSMKKIIEEQRKSFDKLKSSVNKPVTPTPTPDHSKIISPVPPPMDISNFLTSTRAKTQNLFDQGLNIDKEFSEINN